MSLVWGKPDCNGTGAALCRRCATARRHRRFHRTPAITVERMSPEQERRLNRLKSMARVNERITFSRPLPHLPTSSLERLARAPDTLGVELTSANIRRWQRERFASSLHVYLNPWP